MVPGILVSKHWFSNAILSPEDLRPGSMVCRPIWYVLSKNPLGSRCRVTSRTSMNGVLMLANEIDDIDTSSLMDSLSTSALKCWSWGTGLQLVSSSTICPESKADFSKENASSVICLETGYPGSAVGTTCVGVLVGLEVAVGTGVLVGVDVRVGVSVILGT